MHDKMISMSPLMVLVSTLKINASKEITCFRLRHCSVTYTFVRLCLACLCFFFFSKRWTFVPVFRVCQGNGR